MRIKACYLSHPGKKRANNEDSLLVNGLIVSCAVMTEAECMTSEGENFIFIAADGMGGHAKGDVASSKVLKIFAEHIGMLKDPEDIAGMFTRSKEALDGIAAADNLSFGLGTTVTGVLFSAGRAYVFNCGDSRVYRLSGGLLERLTKDHSLVQRFFEEGVITEDQMRTHPQKNIITDAVIGDLSEYAPSPDITEISFSSGQRFLLCTDGVWESIDAASLQGCFSEEELVTSLKRVYSAVMETAARDNLSLIALEVLDE